MQDITLKQLKYFVALADTRHYRKAATRMGISQPSLSQQIVALETVLGLELVERGKRGAILTPGGRDVLIRARDILSDVEGLKVSARDITQGFNGTLKLGSTPTLGPYFLPKVMRHLHQSYPDLKVIVRDAPQVVLQEELLAGRHDLVLTQLPFLSADVDVQRLFREPLMLAVAKDHARDVLTLTHAYGLHSQITALCDELGANMRTDYEGTSLDAIRQMVALDMGVAFLPALYADSEVPQRDADVALVPFRHQKFTRSIGLVWRKRSPHGPMLARLTEVIKTVAIEDFGHMLVIE